MKEAFYANCPLKKEIEITGLHTAFTREMETDYSSQGEFHNFWELAVALEGSVCVATDKNAFMLEKNCMVLHPPMEFHRHFNDTGTTSRFAVLTFDAALMPQVPLCVYRLTPKQCVELVAIIQRIFQSCEMEDEWQVLSPRAEEPFAQQEIKSRLELFLLTVLRGRTMARESCSPEYERIVAGLSGALEENLTLEELAHRLGMSQSNLKRIFSRYCQIGVMCYYRQMRMHRATELLQSGYSVRETAERLNFSSQSAFCNAFKRMLREAPSKYAQEA